MNQLYETDFSEWIHQTIQLLQAGRWQEVDIPHLVEEIEGLGKSERRGITSQLTRLWCIYSSGSINPNAAPIAGWMPSLMPGCKLNSRSQIVPACGHILKHNWRSVISGRGGRRLSKRAWRSSRFQSSVPIPWN